MKFKVFQLGVSNSFAFAYVQSLSLFPPWESVKLLKAHIDTNGRNNVANIRVAFAFQSFGSNCKYLSIFSEFAYLLTFRD